MIFNLQHNILCLYFKTYTFIRLLNTHEELKKNWNLYKQKQTASHKPKFRLENVQCIL